MARTTDGFEIAEADLRLRGPGEFLGTRQHGLPELRVASLVEDFALVELARDDAASILRDDPDLTRAENAPLAAAVRHLFRDKLALLEIA
jgi:ATP-dependent DNA helicase RecG